MSLASIHNQFYTNIKWFSFLKVSFKSVQPFMKYSARFLDQQIIKGYLFDVRWSTDGFDQLIQQRIQNLHNHLLSLFCYFLMQKIYKQQNNVTRSNKSGSHASMCAQALFCLSRWMVRGKADAFCGLTLSCSITSAQVAPELIASLLLF